MDSVLLYSTADANPEETIDGEISDANTYLPFKTVDSAVASRIAEELDLIPDTQEEGEASINWHNIC